MKWKEVRTQYPDSWVLVEALKAESKGNRRDIKEMSVISNYNNSIEAWKGYKDLHLKDRSRELYIFHTCNRDIEVIEEKFTGIRSRQYPIPYSTPTLSKR